MSAHPYDLAQLWRLERRIESLERELAKAKEMLLIERARAGEAEVAVAGTWHSVEPQEASNGS